MMRGTGDLTIRVCFGVRVVPKLSSWQTCWQAGNSGQVGVHLGGNTVVCCRTRDISVLFNHISSGSAVKRDRFQYWGRSLFAVQFMVNDDLCPLLGYTCTESTDGVDYKR